MNKCVFLGADSGFNLENSYKKALEKKGMTVSFYDISKDISNSLPIQRLTYNISMDNWTAIHKANVTFSKYVFINRPDVVIVFCNAPITAGAILYFQSLKIKCVLVWPDAIVNLNQRLIENIPLYDFIASYSSSSVSSFQKLGSKNTEWIPLGGDISLHHIPIESEKTFEYDISFIGNWRPERDEIMSHIVENFQTNEILIQGSGWKKNTKSAAIKKIVREGVITGRAFAETLSKGYLNLNIIDYTNFPAANMRFFEIPIAGALQLSSPCPEMEAVFKEGEHVLYYKDKNNLIEKVQYALNYPKEMAIIRKQGQDLLLSHHTYDSRIESIIKKLE